MKYEELKFYCEERNVELIAVSKTRSVDEILALYDKGQRKFGENRVQEWLEKKDVLPKDIEWHHIGQLQTNKVKYLVPEIGCIHSAGSAKLIAKINQISEFSNCKTNILLQFKIGREQAKSGFNDAEEALKALSENPLSYVNICGVMGMASFTDNQSQIKDEFNSLQAIFQSLKSSLSDAAHFKTISMGMSGDYTLAIACGSTMVRIGSLLFGHRK